MSTDPWGLFAGTPPTVHVRQWRARRPGFCVTDTHTHCVAQTWAWQTQCGMGCLANKSAHRTVGVEVGVPGASWHGWPSYTMYALGVGPRAAAPRGSQRAPVKTGRDIEYLLKLLIKLILLEGHRATGGAGGRGNNQLWCHPMGGMRLGNRVCVSIANYIPIIHPTMAKPLTLPN